MASIKHTIKFGMLRYPTLFPNPVDVLEHLFCVIGNGYDWVDGELVDKYDPENTDQPLTMKYPVVEENECEQNHAELDDYLAGWRAEQKLKDAARVMQMKFVEDNIDTILQGSSTAVYFGSTPYGYYFRKGICLEYAKAFSFPDNIKEDWAKVLYKFLEYWLVALNQEYGTDIKSARLPWWKTTSYKILNYCLVRLGYQHGPIVDGDCLLLYPKDIVEARNAIIQARIRLHPYAHNGQTFEQYAAQMRTIFDRLKSKE